MPNPWDYAKASEHSHQAALFMWANMACNYGLVAAGTPSSYTVAGAAIETSRLALATGNCAGPLPQLKWLHAIHNQGHGDAVRGGKAKAEGVKAGIFDMFLPVVKIERPSGQIYNGLYLELKVGKGQPSDKQLEFAKDMRAAGYDCEIAWGWLEAREKILSYLGICC